MDRDLVALLGFVAMFALMAVRVPIGVAMGIAGVGGFALLSGTPEPAEIEKAKGYLKVAAASETLNIRTMAENLLRTLEPQLTASTETSP